MVYRISPFQKEAKEVGSPAPMPVPADDIQNRLSSLEQKLDQLISGGKFDGLL
jgi:hypothetical protein